MRPHQPHRQTHRRPSDTKQWRAIRAAILKESDTCHICGLPGADAIDHVIPLAHGGTNDRTNLKPAHHNTGQRCNRVKGDRYTAPILKRSGSLNRPA